MGAQGEGEGEERGNCKREEQDFIHAPLNAKQKRDAEESDSFFAPSLFAAAAEKTVTAAALNLGFCSLFSPGIRTTFSCIGGTVESATFHAQ